MTAEEQQLISSWRVLPEKDRKDYVRRISALAMVYRDAVPDEKIPPTFTKATPPSRLPAKRKQ